MDPRLGSALTSPPEPKDSQHGSQITHGTLDLKIITESEDMESDVREDVASILPLIKPSRSDESIAGEIVEQTMKTIEHGFKDLAQKAICPTLTNRMLIKYRDSFDVNNAIFEQCNVLHRDISVNNILVVRDFEGQSASQPVRGLLINYDHAICTDQRYRSHSRRSGSLPFMSIHNLEAHESERTPLDDWESLLYVICWLAKFGINQADSKNIGSDHDAEILEWRKGGMEQIAHEKCVQMHNLDIFRSDILAGFQSKYRLLKLLAAGIYNALFQHQGCEGAIIQTDEIGGTYDSDLDKDVHNLPSDQPSVEQPNRDPLVRRKVNEEAIVRTLLEIIQAASTAAQQILAHRSVNVGSTSAPVQ
ncbi:hypothetical protein EV175_001532 [Coemansia sp. RSA 1933]|nr:hypothetical protein EV175_001532 [Coemansia sp. RSA 1933]